jgi:hypothetical protein
MPLRGFYLFLRTGSGISNEISSASYSGEPKMKGKHGKLFSSFMGTAISRTDDSFQVKLNIL